MITTYKVFLLVKIICEMRAGDLRTESNKFYLFSIT